MPFDAAIQNCKRLGQASAELLIILGIMLLVVVVFVALSSQFLSDLLVQQDFRQARNSVQALAQAADRAYSEGDGAAVMVLVDIPTQADLSSGLSYVGRPSNLPSSEQANIVNIRLGDSDVFAVSRAKLTGELPSTPGKHFVSVVSHGSYVSIGGSTLVISPSSAFASMKKNQTVISLLEIGVDYVEPALVEITAQWNYSDPSLSISPISFVSYGGTKMVVQLSFSSLSGPSGVYEGALQVSATPLGKGRKDVFSVPVSVEVRAD